MGDHYGLIGDNTLYNKVPLLPDFNPWLWIHPRVMYHLLIFAPYVFLQPFAFKPHGIAYFGWLSFKIRILKKLRGFLLLVNKSSFTVAGIMFASFLLTSVTTHFVSSVLLKMYFGTQLLPHWNAGPKRAGTWSGMLTTNSPQDPAQHQPHSRCSETYVHEQMHGP